jgi:hypothetical protein
MQNLVQKVFIPAELGLEIESLLVIVDANGKSRPLEATFF